MAHFFKYCAKRRGFLHVCKKSGCFGFRRRGDDDFDDPCWRQDGTVGEIIVGVSHKEIAAGAAACSWLGEIAGITVHMEYHVASGLVAQ